MCFSLLLSAACPGRCHGSVRVRLWAHCLPERLEGSELVLLVLCDPCMLCVCPLVCVCVRVCVCVCGVCVCGPACTRLLARVWLLFLGVSFDLGKPRPVTSRSSSAWMHTVRCASFFVSMRVFVWSGL